MTHHTVVLNTQTNTNVGIQQEVVFATILPENPGSFKKFCELVRVWYYSMWQLIPLYNTSDMVQVGPMNITWEYFFPQVVVVIRSLIRTMLCIDA